MKSAVDTVCDDYKKQNPVASSLTIQCDVTDILIHNLNLPTSSSQVNHQLQLRSSELLKNQKSVLKKSSFREFKSFLVLT